MPFKTNLYIALRASPHWRSFDIEETRPFLRRVGLPDTLLVDFVAVWDATFTLDYRSLRAAFKDLSLASYDAVSGAERIDGAALRGLALGAEDRVVFVYDDDWLAPDLLARLPAPAGEDGLRWGSLRVGLAFDATVPNIGFCDARPLSPIVYTNNYAVTGAELAKAGLDAVFEHTDADAAFRRPDYAVANVPAWLSCALKHPCSTVSAKALMAGGFFADPVSPVLHFKSLLAAAAPPPGADWLAGPLAGLRAVMDDVRPH
jgi:hypothetical protein